MYGVSVTDRYNCAASVDSAMVIQDSSLVTLPGSITPTDTVCYNMFETYYLDSIVGITTYIWSTNEGDDASGQDNSDTTYYVD